MARSAPQLSYFLILAYILVAPLTASALGLRAGLANPVYNLGEVETTFAHLLKKQGYVTGLAGRWLEFGYELRVSTNSAGRFR